MKKYLDAPKKLVKCIPNMLTLCNSFCGFAAILCTLQAYGKSPEEQYRIFAISAVSLHVAEVLELECNVELVLLLLASKRTVLEVNI